MMDVKTFDRISMAVFCALCAVIGFLVAILVISVFL